MPLPPLRLPPPNDGRTDAHAACALSQVAWSTSAGFWNPPPPPGNPRPPPGKLPDGRGMPDGKPPSGPPDAPVRGPRDGIVMVTPFFCRHSVYAANSLLRPLPLPVAPLPPPDEFEL